MARKRRKESHLINNLVIGISLAVFAFLFYQAKGGGTARGDQRTPQLSIQAFAEKYRTKSTEIQDPSIGGPVDVPQSMAEVDPYMGWGKMEDFFLDDDIKWLHDNAETLAFYYATITNSTDQYTEWNPWHKYCMARNLMLQGAPRGAVTLGQYQPEDKEGIATVGITTMASSSNVAMKKEKGRWKIVGFFGARGQWDDKTLNDWANQMIQARQ